MKRPREFTLSLVAVALATAPVLAQTGTVTGTVQDASGRPLAGAQVSIEGTTIGGLSSDAGRYLLNNVPVGNHDITVVMLGYTGMTESVSVQAGETAVRDFVLQLTALSMDEIVVTATGEQRRREIGNAIAKIETSVLTEVAPVTSFQELLQGRASGVSVIPSDGTVGTGARIRIRGISSATLSPDPLVYVDGIRVNSGSPALGGDQYIGGGEPSFFNDLNPEEIESIEIVKGPSAATLYGTQAANGVIWITTKRGTEGPPRWNIWIEQGLSQDPAEYPGIYYSQGRGANGRTRLCLPMHQAMGQCTIEQLYTRNLLTEPEYSPIKDGYRQQYGAQVSGGNTVRYFVSAEWENETGVVQMPQISREFLYEERGTDVIPDEQLYPNELNKVNLRANLSADVRENMDLNVSMGVVKSDLYLPQTGDNLEGIYGTAIFGTANPEAPNPFGFAPPDQNFAHIVWRENDRFINSGRLNWRPTDFVTAHATVGLDYTGYSDESFNAPGQGCAICGQQRQGIRAIDSFTQYKYSVDLGSSANFDITDRISSRTSIGAQYNEDLLEGTLNSAAVFPPGGQSIDAGATKNSGEITVETKTVGSYLEQQLGWNDRVYVTGAMRVDQNSAFGEGFEAAWYPKASVSFIALDDPDAGWINSLRLRGAFGQSGLQPDANAALRFLLPVTSSILVGDQTTSRPSVTIGGLGNIELRPERSTEYEGGFDATVLDNRVDIQFTYYNKSTTDALVNRELPGSLGATQTRVENLGEVMNQGVEVSVDARLIEREDLSWSVAITGAKNSNELIELGEGVTPLQGFGYKQAVGFPLYGLWWPRLESWEDANGDGIIVPSEVVVSDTAVFNGSTIPTQNLQVGTSLSLWSGRVEVGGLVDYQGGYVSHNVNTLFQCAFVQNCRDLNDPNAPLEAQAKAVAGSRAFGAYAEDASFLKVREAHIRLNTPAAWAQRIGARSASLILTGRNLYTYTNFTSWDPEVNTSGASTDGPNYNFVQAGQLRAFMLRVNLGY
ncbi:MAG: SusC/RagA family TonB-linked outer membrane protein [Gemmatimonadetes bacterium]|nr:SusC/RagA family TonB-linked outer membrane protein [Gemmatimonadota bacterium]MYC92866.1 SusC/RagA family TonB-linked outer membrane protein [Gemmatimonadota bacterium]MYG34278.1 SusC/RagA family TonB-linked outer membrane protein [Gemmatimonadota bacterium]MYJ16635.1 SusC/RagA family TonB-linked outer membrane protein [Gemmatimonadota bacterium]